jgi:hypothetical protein
VAQQAVDETKRGGEGGAHSLGSAGDLAGDVADEAAEPGAQAADHALGLAVAATMDQLRNLAPGTGGDARVGLAQRDAVPTSEAAEDLYAAMQQLAVCRVRHRLGLDGGVDGDALEVLRLDGAGALRGGERLSKEGVALDLSRAVHVKRVAALAS